MADWVLKVVYSPGFGPSRRFKLNVFFDPSTPSMRNVDNGEKTNNFLTSKVFNLWFYDLKFMFNLNIFYPKTMGFDTVEINLVGYDFPIVI